MPARTSHITLELAPEAGHPYGDRDTAYDVYLPLKRNGSLDTSALTNGSCRVRHRRSGSVMHGTISFAEEGKLVFLYGNGYSQDCGCEHLLDGAALKAGQRIAIADASGTPHPFEVVSIKET